MEEMLTYQDLAAKMKMCVKSVARRLKGCHRFQPTRNTVRFYGSVVQAFVEKHWPGRFHVWQPPNPDAKPDRTPDAKPDKVKRTKRPV